MRTGQTQKDRYREILINKYGQALKSAVKFFAIAIPLQWAAGFTVAFVTNWNWVALSVTCAAGFAVSVPAFFIWKYIGELKSAAKYKAEREFTQKALEVTAHNLDGNFLDTHTPSPDHQAQVIAAAKLVALGEMAGGVAHEINTPLAIIRMTVDAMEEKYNEGLLEKEDLHHAFSMIIKTVERISRIIVGLRQFTGNRENLPIRETSIASMIESTLIFCTERFKNRHIKLEYDRLAFERLPHIECRSVEISQVLLNLLSNSFDAVVDLDEKWIHLDAVEVGEFVEISVTDSGRGISKAIQDKVMQPFFTTKDVGQGTGLGLSVAKGLIDSHDGKLFLDRNHPRTRFIIRLPKKQKMKMEKASAA